MKKILDLRFVIGCFFLLVGLILVGYGFLSGQSNDLSAVNRWCGIVFALFGIIMLLISGKNKDEDEIAELQSDFL
ncbi:MAG: hypothetical protein C4308_09130 [Chitinophagaceae bacterium]